MHKSRILLTCLHALGKHPVGYAAIAHLTMTERTDTEYDGHILLPAHLQKSAQITLSAPIEDAFLFLYMIPEYISGYHGYATLLHLMYFCRPCIRRQTGIMYLAHNRDHTMSIDNQTPGIPFYILHLRNSSQRKHGQQ